MKNFLGLLLVLLLQSCFSYKTVEYNNIEASKKQKFEIKKLDRTKIKGRIVSINENEITLEKKGKLKTVVKEEISEVKLKKFSIIKTAVGSFGSYMAAIGVVGVVALVLFPF